MGCVSVHIVALVVHRVAIPVCDDGILELVSCYDSEEESEVMTWSLHVHVQNYDVDVNYYIPLPLWWVKVHLCF